MRRFFPLILTLVLCSALSRPVLAAAKDADPNKKEKGVLEKILSFPLDTAAAGVEGLLDQKIFSLGEVRVSGARISTKLSDAVATGVPHNITVVGSKQMEENGSNDVPAILNQQEAVTYTHDTGQGLGARIDLRGFGGEGKQALVLFDGIRAVEPFDNSTAWQLYPREYLDQVEVQRGGGSTVFGEGALSGVIQMKTKKPTDDLHITTENAWGDFGTERYFADVSGRSGGVGFYFGGRYLGTDGYRQNSDHESGSTLAKGDYAFGDYLHVADSFYFADNKTAIPGPLSQAEVDRDRRQKDPQGQFGDRFTDKLVQNGLEVTYNCVPLGVELSDLFGYRKREQDSIQSFGGFFGGTSVNDLETETYSNVLQGTWQFEKGSFLNDLTLGYEASIDDIHNPFVFRSVSFGPFASERSVDRRMMGFFLQDHLTLWDRLIVESGFRSDWIDWDIYDLMTPSLQKRKQADNLSPKVGIEYRIWEALALYTSYAESFKAPDANALIFETPNIFAPNPNVESQVARHKEIGIRYAHPVLGSLRSAFFNIETKKEILFNDISNLNENFDTRRNGVEVAIETALTPQFQVFSNYTYTRAHFDNGVFDGKTIPLVPESKWSAGFVAEPIPGLKVSGEATGIYSQFALNDFNNIFPAQDYWVAGGRVSYGQKGWEVFVRVENLLDEEYNNFTTSDGETLVNLNPAPTRYFEAGFKMEI